MARLKKQFGETEVDAFSATIAELAATELIKEEASTIRLTPKGRMLSNEVFERFISVDLAV